MIYSDNTFDITNNITTYTRRDFKSVFVTTSNKWYMLNNLDEYEEYGIYGDSFDTYYTGKLVIVNDHEYEWDGTEWVDLGEYVERVDGWTNDTASIFSIKYNGSNYILKATQNDIEFTIFCLQNVPSSQSISFFSSASKGDLYEYELFYAGSVAKMIYDLGNLKQRRIEASCTWSANTEYVIRGTNGNYLDTTSNMKLFINGALLGSKSRSTYDNASDKIGMGYQSAYKYNKEFKIYESTGLLFDIKCKEDNGQYVLYDALGNGELYNYGTEDPVVVTPIMTSQRPKDYDIKSAPTISTIWASTIYRNSAHLTTLMRNDVEMIKIDYMSDDILKKGEVPPPAPVGPAGNEIWYTTTDGNIISGGDGGGAFVVSNEYVNGKGIITYNTIITKLSQRQFAYKTTLTTVTFPNTLTHLAASAFSGCSNLEYVNFPEGLISVSADAFVNTRLRSADLPHSLQILYDQSFRGCSSLRNITYNGTIEEWGNVSKGTNWNLDVPATVVHCTDGDATI